MAKCRKLIFVLAMLLASIAPMRAASFGENRAYASAQIAFQDELWARAEREFAEFVERFPKSERRAEAVLYQAEAQFYQNNAAGTLVLLTANLSQAGKLADEYQFWIAQAHFQKGDFAVAAEAYVEFLHNFNTSPRRLEAMVREAAARARLRDWPRVVVALGPPSGEFARLATEAPTNSLIAQGLLLLAEAHSEQKNFPDVEVTLAPLAGRRLGGELDWRAERLRCVARLALGRLPEALAASTNLLTFATNVFANHAEALAESVALQAEARERLGQRGEAKTVLQRNLTPGTPPARQQHALLKITELLLAEDNLAEASATFDRFLGQTNAPPDATAVALLSLGEIHLRQYVGLLRTNNAALTSEATNHLEAALGLFDRLVTGFTNTPFRGHAELDRGWCFWLKKQMSESATAFEQATRWVGESEDLVVAQFKLGDALFAQRDFARALPAYQSAVEALARWPGARAALGVGLFHQLLRTSLELTNGPVATAAMEQILKQQPRGEVTDRSLLWLVQGLSDGGKPELARTEFERFVAQVPDFAMRAEVELVLGRTREQQGDWLGAVAGYDQWLERFGTNALRPQVEFHRAWVNFQAGRETNAFTQFTNFIAQYPTNQLAPEAQWWVADWYFRQGGVAYPTAEQQFKTLFETWPQSDLAREARMMAGRAALAGARFQDAIGYFTNLTSDLNCPEDLKVKALLAYGGALMLQQPAGTNKLENYEEAIKLFDRIQQSYPTNELAILVWGEKAKCWMQMPGGMSNAWLAFTQLIAATNASIAVRSEAQVGRGQLLEAAAQRASGVEQTNLLQQALDDYLDVVYEKNLRPGETHDLFWIRKAGLAALPLMEVLDELIPAEHLCTRLQVLLPVLKPMWQQKGEQLRERRLAKKNGSNN